MTASPIITRRSDDVHGLGFGQVKTGHVMSRKMSFYQRGSSVEPEVPESPAPRRKVVRFTETKSSKSPVMRSWVAASRATIEKEENLPYSLTSESNTGYSDL